MDRKEFLQLCGILGIGVAANATLMACRKRDSKINKVLIVGAGVAGMTAGHLLRQRGIEFEILEANSTYGGRIKTNNSFTNFPIPLGAEWLHVDTSLFAEIVNDSSTSVSVNTVGYDHWNDWGLHDGEEITVTQAGFRNDHKFIGTSWLNFYETYILPSVQSNIRYNQQVSAIDYEGSKVKVTASGSTYEADRVIFTAPVKILQGGSISFTPALPSNKTDAIAETNVWDGCKAFIKFSNKFYATFTSYSNTSGSDGEQLYYDAAYGQSTSDNIMGMFAVGTGAEPYLQRANSGNDLINYMLAELDATYNNQATPAYIDHIFQNWQNEPFAQAAYVSDNVGWRTVAAMGESVNDKLYFAGDAYTTGNDWGSVHAAARSAIRAIDEMTA